MITGALLDTNACLYLLKGQVEPSFAIRQGLFSVVTELELLGFPQITEGDEQLIRSFLFRFERVVVDDAVLQAAITLRRQYRLRLADALICGSALVRSATLITHDRELTRVKEIRTMELPLSS